MNDTTHPRSPDAPVHTVFGAGQIGLELARILARSGVRVRLARRGPAGPAIDGVTWLRGDVTDPEFAASACASVAVVYNCVNPGDQYHRWDALLPPLTRGVLAAARDANARLVMLDNLYMYGRPESAPFDESAPLRPCSRKGELRARLTEEVLGAAERGDVEVVIGRAADFFGPATPQAAIFRPRLYRRLVAGAPVEVLGDADLPHSYAYTPDVAHGLAILGTHAPARPVYHLPVAAQLSTRGLIERFAATAGVDRVRVRAIPRWVFRAVGVVAPKVGAVAEMVYQWEVPFVASDAAFRRDFGAGPTDLDVACATTLAAHDIATTAYAGAPSSAASAAH